MLRQHYCLVFLAVVAAASAKPPPASKSPWASYAAGKSFSSRSLGPPIAPAMSTITVPYIPKASPFFPKFVDPQAMIAKKTDMLANLFGGLGPAYYPPFPYQQSTPLLYAAKDVDPELQALFDPKKTMSPVASAFSPFSPKFPFAPEPQSSRRKRQIDSETPRAAGPPPPYPPGLGPIPEEPEAAPFSAPKQFLPGMFGPFSPFSPFAPSPVVDPSFFITKKTTFLNTLFKNLATSTPPPPDTETDPTAPKPTIVPPNFWVPFNIPTALPTEASPTEASPPKSTIVPADFWLPSSVIPGPTEYDDKVSQFLDKLFDSLKINKTMSSTGSAISVDSSSFPKAQFARSLEDVQTIAAAKDAIVDSIITELSSIKGDMVTSMNDMILAQVTTPVSTVPKKPKKLKKPISPWAAMFATSTSTPVADPVLPFKQKISVLSQVFDMLTGLQKNVTTAIADSVKITTGAPVESSPFAQFNATLLDAIKAKLDSLDAPVQPKPFTGYWGTPYVSGASKRNVDEDDYYYDDRHNHREQYKRGVKMTVHQGYQSMPPGTIETVQAGGGSVPGHQGGGIKLLIQMPPAGSPGNKNENYQDDEYENYGKQWAQLADYMKSQNQNEGRKHHHNHH